MSLLSNVPSSTTALVVAHPGHELRLFHWLELSRPVVHVLTDGSGRNSRSRLESTSRLLNHAGAFAGGVYGCLSDRCLYDAVLRVDAAMLVQLTKDLAESFIRDRVLMVIGDAEEQVIMAHDLWRQARIAAVRVAERRLGWKIAHYEFALDEHPAWCPTSVVHRRVALSLDDRAIQRKLKAACEFEEVRPFVERNLAQFGRAAFAEEYFFPVDESATETAPSEPTTYEKHGEQQVAAGVYNEVIRFARHVAPLMRSLSEWVDRAA